MDRDDKQMEITLDSLLQRSQDLMKSLTTLLYRIDTEQLDYTDFVDSYASIQGSIHNLMKVIRNNQQLLACRSVFPLKLNPDLDESLAALTDGRLKSFNHQSAPDYLRTKLDPEIETRLDMFSKKANTISADQSTKQITHANKIVQNVTDLIRNHHDESEQDLNRNTFPPTSSMADTYTLVGAIFNGKGLKADVPKSTSTVSQQQGATSSSSANGIGGGRGGAKNTSGPSIKTNIKAAAGPAQNLHYNR